MYIILYINCVKTDIAKGSDLNKNKIVIEFCLK